MKKRVYSATDIMHVDWQRILASRPAATAAGKEAVEVVEVVVGIDVGKLDMRAVLRWPDGTFERPWRVANPAQIGALVHGLGELARRRRGGGGGGGGGVRGGHCIRVAMESTGTYGDALRQALADAHVEAHLVSGKRAHDYAEVFDGVPSQHDGKDAAVVAELCALGKSLAWPWQPSDDEQLGQMMFLVDQLEVATRAKTQWALRLEAMLARHWPEASRVLAPGSATMLRALAHYGGPAALAADPDAAATLQRWGTRWLDVEKVTQLVASARATAGVRQGATDVARVQWCAEQGLAAHREAARCQARLKRLGAAHAAIAAQGAVIGIPTACVLWRYLGDPRRYHCAAAYRKAMGLNLKERSSGRHQGKIKITKRGPGACRRWLHLAALRLIRDGDPDVRAWYARKCGDAPAGKGKGKGKSKDKDNKGSSPSPSPSSSSSGRLRVVTALVRKLALAMWVVGAGRGTFEAKRLLGLPPRRHRIGKTAAGRKGGVAVAAR